MKTKMDTLTLDLPLYVYDIENLSKMKNELNQFCFASIGALLHVANSVDSLEYLDISNYIFDITNIVNNEQNSFFVENYLFTMRENIDDISFCIQSEAYALFKEKYPLLFDFGKINFKFQNQHASQIDDNDSSFTSNTLYTYNEQESINDFYISKKITSLAYLIEKQDGFLFSYDFEKIRKILSEKSFNYVDISSMMKTLTIRKDLVFPCEVLIHKIHSINNVKLCINHDLAHEIMSTFPLAFSHIQNIETTELTTQPYTDRTKKTDIKKMKSDINQINDQLIGHSKFKSDFQKSFMKFSFLNEMEERNILSLLLCGDSGVGKTEFAKILSNVLYPSDTLIKINFGNYSTEGVLNSLIGSPIGYIGSEEGGELINKITSSKSKVILIDEFEKATPSVYNFFYELLEDGKFTDRHGEEHDLGGYIIIFTSNMDEDYYKKNIPNSLKSRFDMVYNFNDFTTDEKIIYIINTTNSIIEKLRTQYNTQVDLKKIQIRLNNLIIHKNLRIIKREIENIVFEQFFKQYKQ